jgi:hypothetical protein
MYDSAAYRSGRCCSNEQAIQQLKNHNWNLQAALDSYFADDVVMLHDSDPSTGISTFFEAYKSVQRLSAFLYLSLAPMCSPEPC